MTKVKRVTANLPADLLKDAMRVTRKGITETLIHALEQVSRNGEEEARRRRFYENAMALKGKIHLDIDVDELRGRNRH